MAEVKEIHDIIGDHHSDSIHKDECRDRTDSDCHGISFGTNHADRTGHDGTVAGTRYVRADIHSHADGDHDNSGGLYSTGNSVRRGTGNLRRRDHDECCGQHRNDDRGGKHGNRNGAGYHKCPKRNDAVAGSNDRRNGSDCSSKQVWNDDHGSGIPEWQRADHSDMQVNSKRNHFRICKREPIFCRSQYDGRTAGRYLRKGSVCYCNSKKYRTAGSRSSKLSIANPLPIKADGRFRRECG